MSGAVRCLDCGAPIPERASLGGKCPACLARLAISSASDRSATSRSERQVAGYRLGRPLGRGPLGSVFEAESAADRRTVAVKTWGYAGGGDAAELQEEAWLASELQHPGIVRVQGCGRYDEGVWVALELMREGSLARRIETARWELGTGRDTRSWRRTRAVEMTRLFAGLADALGQAHQRGVVHLGIKPTNLFVTEDGGLALSDFGAANGSHLLQLSWLDRTPVPTRYLAPEQIDGTAPVGPASDIYAIGACLHDALSLAEDPDDSKRTSFGVPSPVRLVLERCLDPDPGRRPASAVELQRDLLRALEKMTAKPWSLSDWVTGLRRD